MHLFQTENLVLGYKTFFLTPNCRRKWPLEFRFQKKCTNAPFKISIFRLSIDDFLKFPISRAISLPDGPTLRALIQMSVFGNIACK